MDVGKNSFSGMVFTVGGLVRIQEIVRRKVIS